MIGNVKGAEWPLLHFLRIITVSIGNEKLIYFPMLNLLIIYDFVIDFCACVEIPMSEKPILLIYQHRI